MTSIITDIAGFIGSNLAEDLVREGQFVIGVDNLERKGANKNFVRIRSAGDFDFHQSRLSISSRPFRPAPERGNGISPGRAGRGTTSVANPRDDGDGKQVRDVLFIDDLIEAYLSAVQQAHVTTGQVLNIGGGPANTLSIRQLLACLENHLGEKNRHKHGGTAARRSEGFHSRCAQGPHQVWRGAAYQRGTGNYKALQLGLNEYRYPPPAFGIMSAARAKR
ncbi:MAG: NAD-dependent dehydratase [Bryobacterales bacterium]|nr:NAD-dependent dehydratase [Bryobacterales bacterium]